MLLGLFPVVGGFRVADGRGRVDADAAGEQSIGHAGHGSWCPRWMIHKHALTGCVRGHAAEPVSKERRPTASHGNGKLFSGRHILVPATFSVPPRRAQGCACTGFEHVYRKRAVAVSEPISEQDAPSLKAQLSGTATKQWHFLNFADTRAVLTFINTSPVQTAGEISATVRPDGTVALYYFSTVA